MSKLWQFRSPYVALPTHTGKRGRVGQQCQHAKQYKARDEPIQELEELVETRLVWDVIGIGEVRRRDECFTTQQSGHLLYHSMANNGQAGVGFLLNKKWKDHIVRVNRISSRVAELVLCITKRYKLNIVQVYAPTISYSEEDINSFYMDVDETLGKPNHYVVVMGEFNEQIGTWTNPVETATGKLGLVLRNERSDSLLGRMGNIKEIQNHEYHVPEESKEEKDVEKPKRCNEDRHLLHPNK